MMILEAKVFENSTVTYTQSLYQHDKNVILKFDGIDLPEAYEVHFSNSKEGGLSVVCPGSSVGVEIPDALLSTGEYVYAWVCGADEETGKTTLHTITIPVIPRPVPIPGNQIANSQPMITNYELDPENENISFTGYFNNLIDSGKETEEP